MARATHKCIEACRGSSLARSSTKGKVNAAGTQAHRRDTGTRREDEERYSMQNTKYRPEKRAAAALSCTVIGRARCILILSRRVATRVPARRSLKCCGALSTGYTIIAGCESREGTAHCKNESRPTAHLNISPYASKLKAFSEVCHYFYRPFLPGFGS